MNHTFCLTALAAATLCSVAAQAQTTPPTAASASAAAPTAPTVTLAPVTVRASADASAAGLQPAYPGGQVARGGRVGILGSQDMMATPFSITAYTNELIQDRQAKSVGDVLQNDSGVRVARGFGNFQEAYFIRGFVLSSDDIAFNGLYSLLPRQYIATELFERVEVLRGASTFLTGVTPGGDGIGGTVNLVPKRAPNEPLTRVTTGWSTGNQWLASTDIARRFGPDQSTGIRFNASHRDGGSGVDGEHAKLDLLALGLDWHSRDVRLSADLGWQNNELRQTRPNVSLVGNAITAVPAAPDARRNFAQPWSYSNERDLFGTLRGEVDLTDTITAWGAYGLRRGSEANSLANLTVANSTVGAGSTYRFDNTRRDHVDTGEVGVRGKLATGPVTQQWVVSAAHFELDKRNAYGFDYANTQQTNLYTPVELAAQPAFSSQALFGGSLDTPNRTGRTRLTSIAVGDTLGFLGDTLLVTLGARHQTLQIENYAYGTAALLPPAYDESRTSPVVAAVVRVNKQLSVYANYIEALSQGGTAPATANGRPVVNIGQTLAPYVSKQKEVGVKVDTGRFGGSLALFSTERPRAYTGADQVFTSAGRDRHQGAELMVFGRPIASVKLLGGATWLNAKQLDTGASATDGKQVIGVPRTLANLGAEWEVTGVTGLAVDARAVYTAKTYADAANTLEVPGWTRFDAGVRYELPIDGRLVTLRGRVDNLTNRNYWASTGGYPGSGYLVVGQPRTFSLTASVDF